MEYVYFVEHSACERRSWLCQSCHKM